MSKTVAKITDHTIRHLLRERHKADLLFEEISCGAEAFDAGCGSGRFDAWAMLKSWSKSAFIGYEIKVSRRDFMQDTKWPSYLGSCTQFYFVVAPGVCDVREIGEQAGLIEVSSGGARLLTKKKAPRLAPNRDRLFNVLKLALMREGDGAKDTPEAMLEKLKRDQMEKIIGHSIGRELQRIKYQLTFQEQNLKQREERCAKNEETCAEILRIAAGLGINIRSYSRPTPQEIEARLKEAVASQNAVPKELVAMISRTEQEIGSLRRRLEQLTLEPERRTIVTPAML